MVFLRGNGPSPNNITVNGKKMNLAAWLNTEKTKEGQPDISLKISEIVPKQEQPF